MLTMTPPPTRPKTQYDRVEQQTLPCVPTAAWLCSFSAHTGDSALRLCHTAKLCDKVAHVFLALYCREND